MLADLPAALRGVFSVVAALAVAAATAAAGTAPVHPVQPASRPGPTRAGAGGGNGSGPVVHGQATHYGPASTGGNCSFPSVPANKLTVAAGPDLYASGAGCGGYLDVTSGGRTIRVKIDNRCPECGRGHLDLSDEAFAALAPLGRGLITVTYRVVTNPEPAPALSFRVKEGSSRYWLGLLVDGTGNRLRSVEVRTGSRWTALTRTDYGYWLAPSGAGPGAFTVRVTDVAGHRATAGGIRLAPAKVQRTPVRLY